MKSNEIDIVVNPLKAQDRTGAVYDLPVTGLSGENVGVANSIQNTLPLSVTAKGADFRAAGLKISDLFSGNTLILDPLRQDSHDSSVLSFDFSDQQVSSLSFYYGLYYEAHKTNENHISSILLRTSNDGENWTELDITAEVKASISSKNLKLMEKSFAPSSKVQIALTGDIVGKNYSFSLGGIAFLAGKNCHAHEEVPSTIDVTAVSISSPSATVRMGKTLAISDVVTPSNATNKALTYKFSNEEVATLDNNGILTPKKAGTCFVTATSSNSIVSNSLDITVLNAVSLDSSYLGTYKGLDDNSNPVTLLVESGKATLSFEKSGKTDSFVLTLDDYRDSAYSFAGDDGSKMTIQLGFGEKNHLSVTADAGSYTINSHGTHEGLVRYIHATAITLTPTDSSLTVGEGTGIKASYTPSDATGTTVTDLSYSTSDKNVAAVDEENGYVTAVGAGTATITATNSDGIKGTCTITVKAKVAVSSVTLTGKDGKTTLEALSSLALTAAVLPTDAYNKTLAWSSSDTKVATVDRNGVVTGVKEGNVTITVKATDGSGIEGTIDLTVTASTAAIDPKFVGTWTGTDIIGNEATLTISSNGNAEFVIDGLVDQSFTSFTVNGNKVTYTDGDEEMEVYCNSGIINVTYHADYADGWGFDKTEEFTK